MKEAIGTKKELLNGLDARCKPEAIFACNTSSLSITEMGHGLKHPVIGMHFFNPVPSMKLVEIIRGANTTQETFDFVYKLSQEIGKEPVEVAEAPIIKFVSKLAISELLCFLPEGGTWSGPSECRMA